MLVVFRITMSLRYIVYVSFHESVEQFCMFLFSVTFIGVYIMQL